MTTDERAAALQALIDALCEAWTKAGPLSYNEFAKRSMKVLGPAKAPLAASTVHDVLNGRNCQPPRWGWVVKFWTVLRTVAADHGIDPRTLGTLEELKLLHEAADTARCPARHLADGAGAGRGKRPSPRPRHGLDLEGISIPQQRGTLVLSEADAERDERLASIRRKVGVDWWRAYADVVPAWSGTYLSLEPAASVVRVYDTAVVPALLQTEAYADAALRLEPGTLSAADITRITELRMRRQEIIGQPNSPRLWITLDESALRRRLGSAKVMRGQLRHLIDISALPNIAIQVIPSITSVRVTLGYPITMLRFRAQEVPDVAYIEQLLSAFYLYDPVHVSRYTQLLEGLSLEALSPIRTVDHLCHLLRDL